MRYFGFSATRNDILAEIQRLLAYQNTGDGTFTSGSNTLAVNGGAQNNASMLAIAAGTELHIDGFSLATWYTAVATAWSTNTYAEIVIYDSGGSPVKVIHDIRPYNLPVSVPIVETLPGKIIVAGDQSVRLWIYNGDTGGTLFATASLYGRIYTV